jgi:hypothetical protein
MHSPKLLSSDNDSGGTTLTQTSRRRSRRRAGSPIELGTGRDPGAANSYFPAPESALSSPVTAKPPSTPGCRTEVGHRGPHTDPGSRPCVGYNARGPLPQCAKWGSVAPPVAKDIPHQPLLDETPACPTDLAHREFTANLQRAVAGEPGCPLKIPVVARYRLIL